MVQTNKILNNLHYNKTFTLLEDHYFQERLEQYQTPFTVFQLNKMYTGTFTFMPADKNWIYDPTQNLATKTPFTLVWFNDDFCLIFTLQDFLGRMTKVEDRYWIETDSFVHSPHSIKPKTTSGIRGRYRTPICLCSSYTTS